jgi:hypothetical protein
MANVNKPFGLRPMGNLSATGAQKQYAYQIADNQSGAIFLGDLVTQYDGYIVKFVAASHATALGVFNGCSYIDPTTGKAVWRNYYPGSVDITTGIIQADVIDDPNQLFLIQSTSSTAIDQTKIGFNAPISTSTTGSTTTGLSNMTIDSANVAKTSTLALKVVGLYSQSGNEFGAYEILVVKINTHQYGSVGVAGLGA